MRIALWTLLGSAAAAALVFSAAPFQAIDESVTSEHVRMRVPFERLWLAHDAIADLERCWRFVNRATDGKLPRRIVVAIAWDAKQTTVDLDRGAVVVGMQHPAKGSAVKAYLLYAAAKGMARLGLLRLSGARDGDSSEFLTTGMAEIIAHEYLGSSLVSAWVISNRLDRMQQLGLAPQSDWTAFSRGENDLRAASPGVTMLLTIRQLHGREKLIEVFKQLRKGSLERGLSDVLKSSPAAVEKAWLERVRAYDFGQQVTTTPEEQAPVLIGLEYSPETAKAGTAVEVRLSLRDDNLLPHSVFLQDEVSGRVVDGRTDNSRRNLLFRVPVEAGRDPGKAPLRVTAVDESGNVRHWAGAYMVAP